MRRGWKVTGNRGIKLGPWNILELYPWYAFALLLCSISYYYNHIITNTGTIPWSLESRRGFHLQSESDLDSDEMQIRPHQRLTPKKGNNYQRQYKWYLFQKKHAVTVLTMMDDTLVDFSDEMSIVMKRQQQQPILQQEPVVVSSAEYVMII